MSDRVAKVIGEADLGGVCEPRQGDCESVAVALARVFDVESFVCIYEPGERRYATHAAVEIDGQLYDGTGQTSRQALLDHLAMFSPRDFPGVESPEEMFEIFREEQLAELAPDPDVLAYDERVASKVKRRLREARS